MFICDTIESVERKKNLPVRCDNVDLVGGVFHEHSHKEQVEVGRFPIAGLAHHDLRIVAALFEKWLQIAEEIAQMCGPPNATLPLGGRKFGFYSRITKLVQVIACECIDLVHH